MNEALCLLDIRGLLLRQFHSANADWKYGFQNFLERDLEDALSIFPPRQILSASDEPLPVAQAFPLDTILSDDFTLQIHWDTTPGYYLYRHTLKASTSSDSVQLGTPSLPAGTPMHDEAYGDTLVFHEPVTMTVPLIRRGPGAVSLPLTIEYQGCKLDSICYPPQRVQLSLELPAISTDQSGAAMPAPRTEAEQDRLYTVIRDGNLLAVMAMFAGFGLLLSFTPCCACRSP